MNEFQLILRNSEAGESNSMDLNRRKMFDVSEDSTDPGAIPYGAWQAGDQEAYSEATSRIRNCHGLAQTRLAHLVAFEVRTMFQEEGKRTAPVQ